MAKNIQSYTDLITEIKKLVTIARKYVAYNANRKLLQTYWNVGKLIIDREQNDNINEQSRRALLIELSKVLTLDIGTGFSRANLFYMRLLYLNNASGQTLSDRLTWSHWIELLKIEDLLERSFYEKQCISENWSVRELKRQKASLLLLELGKGFAFVARQFRIPLQS